MAVWSLRGAIAAGDLGKRGGICNGWLKGNDAGFGLSVEDLEIFRNAFKINLRSTKCGKENEMGGD
jgi:hypothetical protein